VTASFGQDTSLSETLSWIKGKVESQPTTWVDGKENSVVRDFSFTYKGCDIEYSYQMHLFVFDKQVMMSDKYYEVHQKANLKNIEKVEFQLSNAQILDKINNKDVELKYNGDYPSVVLNTLWGQKLITNWEPINTAYSSARQNESSMTSTLTIIHKEAERLAKALEQAMKLCDGGQKKEKY